MHCQWYNKDARDVSYGAVCAARHSSQLQHDIPYQVCYAQCVCRNVSYALQNPWPACFQLLALPSCLLLLPLLLTAGVPRCPLHRSAGSSCL